jgi:hypothetical protein
MVLLKMLALALVFALIAIGLNFVALAMLSRIQGDNKKWFLLAFFFFISAVAGAFVYKFLTT